MAMARRARELLSGWRDISTIFQRKQSELKRFMEFNTICVVGLGYIGLPTAAIIASRKKSVIGLDVNPDAVATINRGEVHIYEPDLEAVVRTAVSDGYLRATLVPEPADAFLIAVPTPFEGDHQPDLRFIEAAALSIAPVLRPGNIVILESTLPVGATEKMPEWLRKARPDLSFPDTAGENSDIRIAHCPERVLPGHVLRELVTNDRVIGGLTPRCSEHAKALYTIFVEGECILTDARTAEMCKLTENSFRDLNIAFANELSMICARLNIDVWELIALANRHPRVNILRPGPGVGGHCIAVDPWFIVAATPEESPLIRQAREVNDRKPHWVVDQIKTAAKSVSDNKPAGYRPVIACLGLAFKPDIDDLRESPALDICTMIAGLGEFEVIAAEPNITELPKILAENVELLSAAEAIRRADVVVLLVDHRPFQDIDRKLLEGKEVVDTRGLWRRQ
jgi:UDP-N-acetyl-D-mannosaminuronic acid dehydrogenase